MYKKTKDYGIFKKNPFNRSLDPLNLKKLESSIKSNDLLSFRPILVNEAMEVIDGQHRLEVAKKLGIDIYYQINENAENNDIIILNSNQKNWELLDYVHYWIKDGRRDYVKLIDFMKEHNFTLRGALAFMGGSRGGKYASYLRAGNFKFPENTDFFEEKKKLLDEIFEMIHLRTPSPHFWMKSNKVMEGLMDLINMEEFDKELFLKKLGKGMTKVGPCRARRDYFSMFKEIYNYANKNPIGISPYRHIMEKES